MNLSLNWLRDFVNIDGIGVKEYCDRMTDTGSKVEGYEELGKDIENVLVGRIVDIKPHENSDHLQICQIDLGGKIQQIVTGAQNVFVGAIVPAAIPVAHLPGDVTIKSGKLRGVQSDGMLCSFGELGLDEHAMPGKEANGILILDEEFAPYIGKDIREALMLLDTCVEFEITSNRPDCLSVIGLARETAVSFDRPLTVHTPVVKAEGKGDISDFLNVKIEAKDLCPRYSARVVRNVKIAPSPLWMRMRLRAAGVRPINNIVDITNYVMLEYGQPMHAFDYACLDGAAIRVRRAADGEVFRSLDDKEHTLDSTMLVITDEKKAVALAGVMGGANSEISDTTETVVFESACFAGASVRVTAKKNGMRTESSARYEKGLDPENCEAGLARACELVELLGAGEVVPGVIDCYPGKTDLFRMPLECDRINAFLGIDVPADKQKEILRTLDFGVEGDTLVVPSFRGDVRTMNDVAEEVARIYGYNQIVSTPLRGETTRGGRNARQLLEVRLEDALIGMGADQIQTFSFISPKYYDKIGLPAGSKLRKSVVITNPLGEDTSVMRTVALPSMMEVLARNYHYSNEQARLFELATVYLPKETEGAMTELPEEKKVLVIGSYGCDDFYSMKGICENICSMLGVKTDCERVTDNVSYHPGRTARLVAEDGKVIGTFGQVHPKVAETYDVGTEVYCAEIDFEVLFEKADHEIHYVPLPKYPSTTRDFSFPCDESLEVGTIEKVIRRGGGKLVRDVKLFDIYRGPQVGEGKKSVSMRVTLRAEDRTLTVEEADKESAKILAALEKELGLVLRA